MFHRFLYHGGANSSVDKQIFAFTFCVLTTVFKLVHTLVIVNCFPFFFDSVPFNFYGHIKLKGTKWRANTRRFKFSYDGDSEVSFTTKQVRKSIKVKSIQDIIICDN